MKKLIGRPIGLTAFARPHTRSTGWNFPMHYATASSFLFFTILFFSSQFSLSHSFIRTPIVRFVCFAVVVCIIHAVYLLLLLLLLQGRQQTFIERIPKNARRDGRNISKLYVSSVYNGVLLRRNASFYLRVMCGPREALLKRFSRISRWKRRLENVYKN